ncbi:hypothetical protein GQ44DRAFT_730587 [Phaeosphaeriaceae sp. PMI808]|nr:hypothetical protein GQ44DRAFT_730587 [Phaeosphaeriaceae sp. PMI808]
MDTKDFNFRYNRPSTPGSDSTTESGNYRYGEPMVGNYHDVERGSIMTKSQLKPEADDAGMPFSEKSYQMAREDFGGNIGNVNRFGVSDIVNTGWLQKANTHLADTSDLQWKKFERGTPGYSDFLATDNGKWTGYMLTDHHGPMNNRDIVAISVAREKLPDNTYKGYMSIETGAP